MGAIGVSDNDQLNEVYLFTVNGTFIKNEKYWLMALVLLRQLNIPASSSRDSTYIFFNYVWELSSPTIVRNVCTYRL